MSETNIKIMTQQTDSKATTTTKYVFASSSSNNNNGKPIINGVRTTSSSSSSSATAAAGAASSSINNNNNNSRQTDLNEKYNQQTSKQTKTNQNQGFFRDAVPTMPKPLATICLILNIFVPGSGTLLAGLSVFFCATHQYENKNVKAFLINFLAFLLQFCSAVIIFGWIWSIKYGLLFIRLAGKKFL